MAKFTGSVKNNGYSRKKTTYYWKYHCRGCGRSYHRDEVHKAVTEWLQQLQYNDSQREGFIEALATVWRQKQRDKLHEAQSLRNRLDELQNTKSKLVVEMARADASFKADIQQELGRFKDEIRTLEDQIKQLTDLDEDLVRFTKFGLEYTNELMEDWWNLDHEGRLQCQQLIFPGGLTFDSNKKVGTTRLSPIYSLRPNKKALSIDEKALMVELAGTAPASASLTG